MLEKLTELIDYMNNEIIYKYILVAILIGLGLYFTFRTCFVQFRLFPEMFRVIRGEAGAEKKGVSAFQAWTISTASRVGTGNMAGVALAIATGGPGAIFWMWLIALIGGATSFIESTLAQVYKVKDGNEKGAFRGGPAYYMKLALHSKGMAVLFSILITITYGFIFNAVQTNTMAVAFNNSFHMNRFIFGIVVMAFAGLVIFGGVKRIARFTGIVVPVMAIIYLIVAFIVLIMNLTDVPSMIALIFTNAFGLKEVVGGGIGAAILQGIKRGLFSNEAGLGSAPNAAAAANVSHPAKQGLVQTLSVFTDTLLICSATAFMILISDVWTDASASDGIRLTQQSMNSLIGDWAGPFVGISILFFAFSSVIGNYYYGESNIKFHTESRKLLTTYRIAILFFILFGAVTSVPLVWSLADFFMALMALTNLVAITLLSRIAFMVLKDYINQKKQGKNPIFKRSNLPQLKNIECWGDEEMKGYEEAERHTGS